MHPYTIVATPSPGLGWRRGFFQEGFFQASPCNLLIYPSVLVLVRQPVYFTHSGGRPSNSPIPRCIRQTYLFPRSTSSCGPMRKQAAPENEVRYFFVFIKIRYIWEIGNVQGNNKIGKIQPTDRTVSIYRKHVPPKEYLGFSTFQVFYSFLRPRIKLAV